MSGRKLVLYGAIARHNFGDLLFAHIVENLILSNNVFDKSDIIFADVMSSDMRYCGGHSVVDIISVMQSNDQINVIHIGGETLGCPILWAVKMITDNIPSDYFESHKILGEYPYILSKKMFKNPGKFISNAIGGVHAEINAELACKLKDFDLVSVRDAFTLNRLANSLKHSLQPSLIPDCAVLTRKLFDKSKIQDFKFKLSRNYPAKTYIAFQVSADFFHNARDPNVVSILVNVLNNIIGETKKFIVFFCAGLACYHDRLDYYKTILALPGLTSKENISIYDDPNIWGICKLIANSYLVISTSLHVRIIASTYDVPRITLYNGDEPTASKHKGFITSWDTYLNQSDNPTYLNWIKLNKANLSLIESRSLASIKNKKDPVDVYEKAFKNIVDLLK